MDLRSGGTCADTTLLSTPPKSFQEDRLSGPLPHCGEGPGMGFPPRRGARGVAAQRGERGSKGEPPPVGEGKQPRTGFSPLRDRACQTISHTRHQEKSPRQARTVAKKPRPARRRGFGGSPRSWKPRHTAGLGPFKGRSVRNSRFAGRSQVLKWLPNLFLHDCKNLHGLPPGFSAPSKVLTGSVPKLGTFCQQPEAPQKPINPQPDGL